MKAKSYLSQEIDSARENAKYDNHVKRLLSDKGILGYILMYAVEEFKGYTLEEARNAIEGEPEVACRGVYPGSCDEPEAIRGENTESSIPGEGKMTFDIVFFARTRNREKQKIYVNIEAQNSFYPGYDLVTRGVIYGARLLSEQMDTEYTSDNYDGAKKVYSIWICMNTPDKNNKQENVSDSIVEYAMEPKVLYQSELDCPVALGRYDLLSVVFICLADDSTVASDNKLIGMLSTLLSSKISVNNKKESLEKKYGLPMSRSMERECNDMCNLSKGIEERAKAEGIERGIEQGIEQGIEKGRLEEKKATAKSLSDMEMPVEQIAKVLKVSTQMVQEWLSDNTSTN